MNDMNINNNNESDDDSIPMATFNVIDDNNRAPDSTSSTASNDNADISNTNDTSYGNDSNMSIPLASFNIVSNGNTRSNNTTQQSQQQQRPLSTSESDNRRLQRQNNSVTSFGDISLGLDTLPNRRGSMGSIPAASSYAVNNKSFAPWNQQRQQSIPLASVQVINSAPVITTATTTSSNTLLPIPSTTSITPTSTPIASNVMQVSNNSTVVDVNQLLYQTGFNEAYLVENSFPKGLIQTIKENHENVLKRFWVIDNSGSMLRDDSHRILIRNTNQDKDGRRALRETNNSYGFLSCTRWRELQQCILLHIETAAFIGLNTTFKLLNKPGFGRNKVTKFSVANSPDSDPKKDTQMARELIMKAEPSGTSPLTRALAEIRQEIQVLAPYLQADDKKVYVIIATDGLPTKNGKTSAEATNEFLAELRALELYPVWIIIRLCSSDEETMAFYKGLDNELERNVDVVLTLSNEMRSVRSVNPWLNYTYPLQYCRESGSHIRLFDIINERPLTLDEVISMCKILFGDDAIDELPDPHVDWKGFSLGLGRILEESEVMWNPHSNRLQKQINLMTLNKRYGSKLGGGGGLTRSGSGRSGVYTQTRLAQEGVESKCSCTIS